MSEHAAPIDRNTLLPAPFTIHFGGPDLPPGSLRDMLLSSIEATPAGGAITWLTYYFRDRGLAQALVAASRRGVRVRVIVESRPRRRGANDAVIDILRSGIGDGLRLHRGWFSSARLHAKIYAFSGPQPQVLVGSFNPSGDTPEDADVVAEIGDQNRGHNLLIGFVNPMDAAALHARADQIWQSMGMSRFSPSQNRKLRLQTADVFFYPRLAIGIVEHEIAQLRAGDVVLAAVSHLHHGLFTRRVAQAASRGVRVELIVHDTRRRVPQQVVTDLAAAGVHIQRYLHPEDLPMHAKFVLLERDGRQCAWVGSLNFNFNSRLLNQEFLARIDEHGVLAALNTRFQAITHQAEQMSAKAPV